MPARWRMGLALLALCGAGPLGARPLGVGTPAAEPLTADPPLFAQALTRCLSQPRRVRGPTAPRSPCPGVDLEIYRLGLLKLLPPHRPRSLSARELAALDALAQRYGGAAPSARPSARSLRATALELAPPSPAHTPSWWDRLKLRLTRFTAPFFHLLERWFESVAPQAKRAAVRDAVLGFGGLLLLAAIVFLVMELRAAGLLRSGGKAKGRRRLPSGPAVDAGAATAREPQWELLREHPAMLLRVLVDALKRSRRLDADRHLTCRELVASARFDEEHQRERFATVARLAERELFGPGPAIPVSEEILRDAETLRAELTAGGFQATAR